MFKKRITHISDLLRMVRTRDSFVQNAAFMFSSTGLSMVIQFAFFPILSRLYSQEAYGLFAVFNSYSATLGSAVTLSYSQAFVLARDERKLGALIRICLLIALSICGIVTIASLFFGQAFLRLMESEELGTWIYFVGPMALMVALDRVTMDWATRNKEFRRQTIWSTTSTLVTKGFNAIYGWMTAGIASGLFISNFVVYGFQSLTYFLFVLRKPLVLLRMKLTRKELMETAREFSSFPKYILPGNMVNTLSNNFPAAMLPAAGFSLGTVGLYTNANLILDIPVRLMGSGISSVFLPKAADMLAERPHELRDTTWRLMRNMIAVSLLFCGIVFLAGEPLYSFYLGKKWQVAGQVAEVLAIYNFFRLVSGPLAVLFNVMRREREYFIFQFILLIVRFFSLWISTAYTDDFITVMIVFSAANAVCYLALFLRIAALIRYPVFRALLFILGWSGAVFGTAWLIKTNLGWNV